MKAAWRYLPMAAVLLLAACRSSKPMVATGLLSLEPRSAEELLGFLKTPDTDTVRYYSAKADVDLVMGEERKSFKAHVRVVRDSAAWVSITPALGIEVARLLVTPDSLKFIDKLHDTYWVGDTAQAKARFGIQPGLDFLQDALIGLPFGLDHEEKYRSDREGAQYVLTSKERKKFVRAAEDLSPGDTLPDDKDMRERKLERTLRKAERKDAVVFRYWISGDSLALDRVQVADLAHDQQADVRYFQRILVENTPVPARIVLSLSAPGKAATATLDLDRIQLHGPLNLPFRIPEKFLPME